MKVVVASTNPVKASAVHTGFSRMFPDETITIDEIAVESGVSSQPLTDAETISGACNRVENARLGRPEADFWVGLEGGIETIGDEIAAFAWIVVLSADGLGKARTGTFFLPAQIAQLVSQGYELGEADDIVFGRSNSKQENGAIGLLTGNVVDRTALYEQAVVLALVRFKNPELYELK